MTHRLNQYQPNLQILPTLAYIVLLSVLIQLGNWQLDRSYQKQQLLVQQTAASNESELDLSALLPEPGEMLRYRHATASGHYDGQHQFLLDNQINNGKPGYLVLTPFVLANRTQAVLVNRGWIPLGQNRSLLPDVALPSTITIISGRINHFPSIGLLLPGAELPSEGWPSRVQVINSQVLSEKLGYALLPFQIELAENQPNGYQRDWRMSTLMLPEQHKAYAYQWFALALVLTLLFIRYSVKKRDE